MPKSFCCCPLWTLSNLSTVLKAQYPKLDTVLQVKPHLGWTDQKNNFLWFAYNIPVNASLYGISILSKILYCWLCWSWASLSPFCICALDCSFLTIVFALALNEFHLLISDHFSNLLMSFWVVILSSKAPSTTNSLVFFTKLLRIQSTLSLSH